MVRTGTKETWAALEQSEALSALEQSEAWSGQEQSEAWAGQVYSNLRFSGFFRYFVCETELQYVILETHHW